MAGHLVLVQRMRVRVLLRELVQENPPLRVGFAFGADVWHSIAADCRPIAADCLKS